MSAPRTTTVYSPGTLQARKSGPSKNRSSGPKEAWFPSAMMHRCGEERSELED